jgi:hypothetical protein
MEVIASLVLFNVVSPAALIIAGVSFLNQDITSKFSEAVIPVYIRRQIRYSALPYPRSTADKKRKTANLSRARPRPVFSNLLRAGINANT